MQNWNWKKKVGLIIFALAVLVITIEVLTGNALSDVFGRIFCGQRYMVMVDGRMGDGVCGFNADIMTIMVSFLALLVGIVFMVLGRKRKSKNN